MHNGWDHALKVTAAGTGLVGHAGAVLLRKAADHSGLTVQLSVACEGRAVSPLLDRGLGARLPAVAITLGATSMKRNIALRLGTSRRCRARAERPTARRGLDLAGTPAMPTGSPAPREGREHAWKLIEAAPVGFPWWPSRARRRPGGWPFRFSAGSVPFQCAALPCWYPQGPGIPADYREEGASMSRFRRALAGAAMAVAMAGGGLLAAMAGAAPAHAATAPAPAAVATTFSFTVVPAAQAAGGIGPKFQCGDTCDPNGGGNPPPAPAHNHLHPVPSLPTRRTLRGTCFPRRYHLRRQLAPDLQVQNVLHRGSVVDTDLGTGTRSSAHTNNVEACDPGQWQFFAYTYITLPPGWVVLSGTNPMNSSSPIVIFDCGGGSSGGGCATGTPSVPAQPAARLPMVVTC